jgi:hypothetical protein
MQNSYGKGLAIRSAPSLALIPRGTQGSVDRGIGGVGYWAAACPEKKKRKADVFSGSKPTEELG